MARLPFIAVAVCLFAAASALAQDVASVGSLRERGQLAEAEKRATELWQQQELPPRERAELAIEMALLYTEQALAAAPEAREALWAKAVGICDAFLERWPQNPRRRLVEVQRALVWIARGGQARAAGNLAAALQNLRIATRSLADTGEVVGRELIERRLRSKNVATPDGLSIEELESLELHVAFQLARAERQMGLCHPLGSVDRDDALLQAARRLAPVAQQRPADELVWNARVELAACRREFGDGQAARRLVEAWLREDPPKEVKELLTAAATQPPVEVPQQEGDQFTAALAAAAADRKAGRHAAAAERYRNAALQHSQHEQAPEAHRLAILATADWLRAAAPDDRAEALRSYEAMLAEHLDRWAGQPASDEVRLWQGQLLAMREDWAAAIAVLQSVQPGAPVFGPSVKLVADCYQHQLQQLAGQTESNAKERAELLAAATQFLQPVITGQENRWPEAWSTLQRETAIALAQLHLQFADRSSTYAEHLLRAALGGPAAESADGERWRATAQALLIAALARGGKAAEARPLVNELEAAPPGVVLQALRHVADGITGVTIEDGGDQRELGRLALDLLRLIDARHSELGADELARIDRIRAAALAATGDSGGALTHYAALAAGEPGDGEVQEEFAALLSQSDSPEQLRKALSQWKRVEARSRRGGQRWRRARRARIELLTRLGETAEAEKLLQLSRVLYPDWDVGQPAP